MAAAHQKLTAQLQRPAVALYRPDIDGLRAVAVIAVLAYHAFPEALVGGYTGVDVFFVISGYLISSMVLIDLRDGRFTFADFYARRIRRIFPALSLVLAFVLVAGWQVMLPADFLQLGKHVAAGAGFVANFALYSESGYFAPAADLNPLLHLWSLGIEEQYYLIWPAMLYVLRKHVHRIFWMIVAVAAASFILNVVMTPHHARAAFFLPMTRFWELMLGSLVAYVKVFDSRIPPAFVLRLLAWPPGRQLLSAAGAALLAAGFLLIDDSKPFPGWWALLPTVGTVFLICAGPGAWINLRLLSHRLVIYIGLISYPLYLWHWPLLTYARILNDGAEPPAIIRVGAILISVLLAVATYELVEKKVRRARLASRRRSVVPTAAAAMVSVGACGVVAWSGLVQAHASNIPQLADITAATSDWEGVANQVILGNSAGTVLFFGDSHMQQYLPRIAKLTRERQGAVRTVIIHTLEGCAPVPGVDRIGHACEDFVRKGYALARSDEVTLVVISASWAGFATRTDLYRHDDIGKKSISPLAPTERWVMDGLESAIHEITSSGKEVIIVTSSPRGAMFDPRTMIVRSGINITIAPAPPVPRATAAEATALVDARVREIAARVGATVVDPFDWACSGPTCPVVDATGRPLYMDSSHFRASAVRNSFDLLDRLVYPDPIEPQAKHAE